MDIPVIRVRDSLGEIKSIPAIVGPPGATGPSGIDDSGDDYIKFVDGTLICWGSALSNTDTTTAAGALYSGTFIYVLAGSLDFPVSFISPPIVTASCANVSISPESGAALGWVTSISADEDGINTINIMNTASVSGPFTAGVTWTAIGKWK